jgi:hypothetical protein
MVRISLLFWGQNIQQSFSMSGSMDRGYCSLTKDYFSAHNSVLVTFHYNPFLQWLFLPRVNLWTIIETVSKTDCNKKTETPWSEDANELYRPSDRRLSAKWLPTFADRVPRGQRGGSLRPYSRFSRQEPLLFYQAAPQLYSRGWVDPVPDLLFSF